MTKDEALKLALEALERYETKRQDDRFADIITAIKEALALAQPEQIEDSLNMVAQREWVGLTPADYDAIRPRVPYIAFCDVAAIIEAKLKELNT